MKRIIALIMVLSPALCSCAAAENADEHPDFRALTGLDELDRKLESGITVSRVYYTDGYGFSISEFTTTDQEEIEALRAALNQITVKGRVNESITDWYPQIVFYLSDGTTANVTFESHWLSLPEPWPLANYELENDDAFWGLTASLVKKYENMPEEPAGTAGEEDTSFDLFNQIQGQLFEFSSGVGGWSTELVMGENGTFTGNYHDSEMGDTGEGYPDGTVYGCTFHGQFSDPEAVDEYSWQVQVSVELDEGQVPETTEDGIRYVTISPYGLERATSVLFFLPGTPVDRLTEGFMAWSHLEEIAPEATEIPYYAIWNEADEAGFVVYPEGL